MKTIVFARHSPTPRICNEVSALSKTKKYKTILLCVTLKSDSPRIYNKVFDEIYCCLPPVLDLNRYGLTQNVKNSPKIHHLKQILTAPMEHPFYDRIIRKRLIHYLKTIKADLFNCIDTYELTKLVLENTKCPVIMDLQDGTISEGIKNLSKERYEMDKYCFENVSGIIHRGPKFEIEYYQDNGYNFNCPTLNYLDYCNKDFFIDEGAKKLSSKDSEYHVVSMGSGMNNPGMIEIIKKLTKQNIHIHLYVVPHSLIRVNMYREYFKLNSTNKYFHLEKAVPFDKVSQEISKYDFGSLLFTNEHFKEYQPEYKKTCLPYRIFNWLEAGLPVIISSWYEYALEMINSNKIGLMVEDRKIDRLGELIDSYDYKILRKNVFTVREKFEISHYSQNLVNFYDRIISRSIVQ